MNVPLPFYGIHQTRDRVFHHIQTPRRELKIQPTFPGIWKCNEKLFRVFEFSSQSTLKLWRK